MKSRGTMDHRGGGRMSPRRESTLPPNKGAARDRRGSVNFMRGFIHKQLENRAGKNNNNNSGEEPTSPTSAFAPQPNRPRGGTTASNPPNQFGDGEWDGRTGAAVNHD